MADQTPDAEEEAKFYLENSIKLVGYRDTLDTGTGNSPYAEGTATDPDQFVRNLRIAFAEGVQRNMRNSREHGSHPINAFEGAVNDDWPEWVQTRLAESEHIVFSGGFREDRPEEEQEYLDYLETEFGVPQ